MESQQRSLTFGRRLKRLARASIAPVIFFAITGYFGWNATRGAHGLVAFAQRQVMLREALADQTAAQKEHDHWEIRVSGLRANHLDPDTLDERARAMLNLAKPNDVIVQYSPKDKLF